MNENDVLYIVKTLLGSVYNKAGDDGLLTSFALRSQNNISPISGISVTVYFRRKKLLPAAIKFRTLGPNHLRFLPVGHCIEQLRNFLSERYHLVIGDNIFSKSEASLLERLEESHINFLVHEFSKSDLLNPTIRTYLFPLTPIQINHPFSGSIFSLSSASDLRLQPRLKHAPSEFINGEHFPPFKGHAWKTEPPSSWLLVDAPSEGIATRYRSSILGALSLVAEHKDRHIFTGRKLASGVASFGNNWEATNSRPHTPAIGSDITINNDDREWLEIIDVALTSTEESETKKIKTLQYFYRSWFLPGNERFPIDCITIDSMFGDAKGATEAVAYGVDKLFDGKLDRARVLLLMRLRNSVIHGGAPDVYDSKKYAKYYHDYGDDPIADMSALVAESIRKLFFGGKIKQRPGQSDEIARKLAALGRISPRPLVGILRPIA